MNVFVNGEKREFTDGISLEQLINELGVDNKTVASAVNSVVVKKTERSSRVIVDKDQIELLNFVGGG